MIASMDEIQLIGHGAEAKVYKVTKQNNILVVKQRLPKKYRHPELDRKINESRIKSEGKIMEKLKKKGVRVPGLIKVDLAEHKIMMEYISGVKLKDFLNASQITKEEIDQILIQLGKLIHIVHDIGVIHGDLTTSNMIHTHAGIYLIDFGLSHVNTSAEDRAVDLYVLERAFKSTHPHLDQHFQKLLVAYGDQPALKKLEVVRQRGRKKVAFG